MFSHLLFDPAGGTLVAQSLMTTALPVLCCMGDSLRIPMIFFFFFYPISLASLFIHPSSCLSLLPFMFLLLPLRLHPPGLVHGRCCFLSLRLISCLSLPLTAFFFHCLSWGLLAAAGLSCAVICHTTEVEKKHFLLMLPPPLLVSHCFSPFSFLPSSQFSTSPLLFLQKSPKDQFIGRGSLSQNVRQLSNQKQPILRKSSVVGWMDVATQWGHCLTLTLRLTVQP